MSGLWAALVALALVLAFGLTGTPHARAQDCTAADYAAAVDRSGAELGKTSREMQPKLQERMRRYQQVKGQTGGDYEGAALEAIQDKKLEDLDAKSSELLLKIDAMGRLPDGKPPSCAEVADIDALGKELLSVVRVKTDYILARLDAKIAEAGGAPAAAANPAKEADKGPGSEPPKAKEQTAAKAPEKPAEPKPAAQPAAQAPTPDQKPDRSAAWSATTKKPDDAYKPPAVATTEPPAAAAADVEGAADQGYSIEEIQDATRGFFGTISTSLASVIEHAFKTSGRPTAYVLGTEGGGAFLAGLRFGDGTLFMRNHPETHKVWWHGPSIGGDFGASGTRTIFLIYRLNSRDALFRSFTGVDGSAFFVGGVGMTVLKGGEVIMAPIRTGLGFRVGASVGYVRFTDKPTWNPF